jgi:hypothetical protein
MQFPLFNMALIANAKGEKGNNKTDFVLNVLRTTAPSDQFVFSLPILSLD